MDFSSAVELVGREHLHNQPRVHEALDVHLPFEVIQEDVLFLALPEGLVVPAVLVDVPGVDAALEVEDFDGLGLRVGLQHLSSEFYQNCSILLWGRFFAFYEVYEGF